MYLSLKLLTVFAFLGLATCRAIAPPQKALEEPKALQEPALGVKYPHQVIDIAGPTKDKETSPVPTTEEASHIQKIVSPDDSKPAKEGTKFGDKNNDWVLPHPVAASSPDIAPLGQITHHTEKEQTSPNSVASNEIKKDTPAPQYQAFSTLSTPVLEYPISPPKPKEEKKDAPKPKQMGNAKNLVKHSKDLILVTLVTEKMKAQAKKAKDEKKVKDDKKAKEEGKKEEKHSAL